MNILLTRIPFLMDELDAAGANTRVVKGLVLGPL